MNWRCWRKNFETVSRINGEIFFLHSHKSQQINIGTRDTLLYNLIRNTCGVLHCFLSQQLQNLSRLRRERSERKTKSELFAKPLYTILPILLEWKYFHLYTFYTHIPPTLSTVWIRLKYVFFNVLVADMLFSQTSGHYILIWLIFSYYFVVFR